MASILNLFKRKKQTEQKANDTSIIEKRLKVMKALERMMNVPSVDHSLSIQPPEILPGVAPKGVTPPVLAMDNAIYNMTPFTFQNMNAYGCQGFTPFPGYAYLASLASIPEYRNMAEINASEITREWIKIITNNADDEKSLNKIKIIEQKLEELHVKDAIKEVAKHVDLYGRGQIFIKIEGNRDEKPLILSDKTVTRGSFKSIHVVEPIWTTPAYYNTLDPTSKDFYVPTVWYMLGKEVHASRLLSVITRPMPDIFKPAFNFSGLSLTQMAEMKVKIWLDTEKAIGDIIKNFSITALMTDMEAILSGVDDTGQNLEGRIKMFLNNRSNQGLMVLDKDREELAQLNMPLSGLPELQSQAQERLCAVSRIPAVKLFGVSPAGFNATADGEIRAFYDTKAAEQEAYYRKPIQTILELIMLSEFGEIDENITFKFNPLFQLDAKEEAEVKLSNAQSHSIYINDGVFTPEEIRALITKDLDSGFDGISSSNKELESEEPDTVPILARGE